MTPSSGTTLICGATGSGKSQTSRSLLEPLALAAPGRFHGWSSSPPRPSTPGRRPARAARPRPHLRPGDLASPPASINPLEPEGGFPLQSHADLIRALFLAAFEANEAFPQILSEALLRCYTSAGSDLVSGECGHDASRSFRNDGPPSSSAPRYPTLGELQAAARDVVDSIGYGKEVAADVRGFVDVRIGSLRGGTPGRFFEGGHPLDIGGLLRRNVVLELEPITNDQDKAFLMGAVLIRIVEHLRSTTRPGHARPAARPADRGSAPVAEKRRRPGRSRGGAVRVPAGRDPGLRRRCRGGRADPRQDRARRDQEHRAEGDAPAARRGRPEAVGATMNLDEAQSEAVVALPPGVAAATVDGADRPLLIQVPLGEDRESRGHQLAPPLSGRRSQNCGKDCLARACTCGRSMSGRIAKHPR